jgi:hypothetical protein
MIYDFVIKSKRIWVPPAKGRKGYFREDPREKHIIDDLKDLLKKIIGMKKKGSLSNEQRKYIHGKLKELEPRARYFKNQKQRMEVIKVLKAIRTELEEKTTQKVLSKDGKEIPDEFREGLKKLGYALGDMKKRSLHEIKAIHYNDIRKEK